MMDPQSEPTPHGTDHLRAPATWYQRWRTRWYIMITGAFLCALAPGFFWLSTAHTAEPIGLGLGPLAIVELSAVRLTMLLAHEQRRIHEMVFWIFTYVFMGLAPMVQFRWGIITGTTPNVQTDLIPAATMAIILGCAAWILGSAYASWRLNLTRETADGGRSPHSGGLKRQPVLVRVWVLCLFSMVVFVYYVVSLGGIDALFLSRTVLDEVRAQTWSDQSMGTLISSLATMTLLVGFVASVVVRDHMSHGRMRVASRALMVIMLCMVLLAFNPVSTPRYMMGTAILAVLAAAGIYAQKAGYRIMMMITVFGFLFIFPLADAFRYSETEQIGFTNPANSFLSGDFDSFNQVINTIEYVESKGDTSGLQLLGSLLFWVPRSIWPIKPEASGILLADFKGYSFTNLSAPIWSEALLNFGFVGVIVLMGVLGYVIRHLDANLERALLRSKVPGILGSVLPFYLMMLWRGSMMVAVADLAVILLSWVLATRWARPPHSHTAKATERI